MRYLLLFLLAHLSITITAQSWVNPVIECLPKAHEKPIKQYPIPPGKIKDSKAGDLKGMKSFNERMRSIFEDSNMDSIEAISIYQLIADSGFIKNESYGMPSPGDGDSIEVLDEIEQLRKIVAISKIEEGRYDLLFSRTGCGRKFYHYILIVESDSIRSLTKVECWSASYPC